MANVAYIRVSSQQQDLGRQKYLFSERNIKIDKVFEEKISGKNMDREVFKQMMDWFAKEMCFTLNLSRDWQGIPEICWI